ncbi:MAG: AAA family ATPase [Candidatus Yonathbacteria bacterium]|nr:AAA family ATPase [Candidatus Yonathbacteria bacterium]NTW48035.1 AAA family ATPase [Candidatus Yonathbacteria bacterium]
MSFITQIKIKNFRGFREEILLDFSQASYLVGINNSGKTNVLYAIRAFFDDQYFSDETFLNRTEYSRKQEKYNQSEISVSFNLRELSTKSRKTRMIREYGDILLIKKIVTFTPTSKIVSIKWFIGETGFLREELSSDIKSLLASTKVTYIHPQDGQILFDNVQRRLRDRLLQNWGRNARLTHQIQALEDSWGGMKNYANDYLSNSLSESLQSFWPGCRVSVSLPKNISDVIAVSDVNFQGDTDLPEIQLTAQGTGAQATVLYLAQYLLDSDRSLNKGEYHPIWLMEEPESFLHADLLFKISNLLNSETWLNNIQMVVTTHSPVLLAGSRISGDRVKWNILKGVGDIETISPQNIDDERIKDLGKIMGDSNFFAYFFSSSSEKLIFCEDEKKETVDSYKKVGIPIVSGLSGITEIGKYLDVITTTPDIIRAPVYFIIDSDKGKMEKAISRHLQKMSISQEVDGFKDMLFSDIKDVHVILLPEEMSIENLFEEYENHLSECVSKIWNEDFSVLSNPPADLSSVVSKARRIPIINREDAINLIKNENDVKALFWRNVSENDYEISRNHVITLKNILGLV